MAEVKKIATRDSYGNALAECGAEYKDLVVLDADLANATKTLVFKKAFPDRHIDCGIAECNMTGIAAGLATCGKIPFISSFAMFAAGRNFEQIRNSIGYPHLNVKIGATHAGITVGEDGASHQCLEDIALMRTIPGMTVIVPSDDVEAKAAVRAAIEYQGPVFLRFGRAAVPVINDRPYYKFEMGKGVLLREGTDVTIIAGSGGYARGGRHQRGGHQYPHDQAVGRGACDRVREEDRQSRDGGGAQRDRRTRQRGVRLSVPALSDARLQDRYAGHLRRVRNGGGARREIRSGRQGRVRFGKTVCQMTGCR